MFERSRRPCAANGLGTRDHRDAGHRSSNGHNRCRHLGDAGYGLTSDAHQRPGLRRLVLEIDRARVFDNRARMFISLVALHGFHGHRLKPSHALSLPRSRSERH